uniref:Uncharacterized protein n=1 Tax=Oryza brachyantha TaxID=4533 RepID=J3LXJ9_ORYBR
MARRRACQHGQRHLVTRRGEMKVREDSDLWDPFRFLCTKKWHIVKKLFMFDCNFVRANLKGYME